MKVIAEKPEVYDNGLHRLDWASFCQHPKQTDSSLYIDKRVSVTN